MSGCSSIRSFSVSSCRPRVVRSSCGAPAPRRTPTKSSCRSQSSCRPQTPTDRYTRGGTYCPPRTQDPSKVSSCNDSRAARELECRRNATQLGQLGGLQAARGCGTDRAAQAPPPVVNRYKSGAPSAGSCRSTQTCDRIMTSACARRRASCRTPSQSACSSDPIGAVAKGYTQDASGRWCPPRASSCAPRASSCAPRASSCAPRASSCASKVNVCDSSSISSLLESLISQLGSLLSRALSSSGSCGGRVSCSGVGSRGRVGRGRVSRGGEPSGNVGKPSGGAGEALGRLFAPLMKGIPTAPAIG